MLNIHLDVLKKYGFDVYNKELIVSSMYGYDYVRFYSGNTPEGTGLYIEFKTLRGSTAMNLEINNNVPARMCCWGNGFKETEILTTTKEVEDFIFKHKIKLGFDDLFTVKKDITTESLTMLGFEKLKNDNHFRHVMKGSYVELYFTSGEWMDTTTKENVQTISEVVNLIGSKQFTAGQVDKADEIKNSLFL